MMVSKLTVYLVCYLVLMDLPGIKSQNHRVRLKKLSSRNHINPTGPRKNRFLGHEQLCFIVFCLNFCLTLGIILQWMEDTFNDDDDDDEEVNSELDDQDEEYDIIILGRYTYRSVYS